ncbi:MAG TPA: toxin [Candidatus Atribacteria bacterium]|nr:toxin [Candidatus Atribacteria bacterium]
MKNFVWNEDKNEKLKRERNVSFEIILLQIEAGKILDILEHPNSEKYQGQKIFVIEFEGYAFLVPFVEDEQKIFLKTIIPSRKATKFYLKRG